MHAGASYAWEPLFEVNTIPVSEIAIEYYASAAHAPVKYAVLNSQCGVKESLFGPLMAPTVFVTSGAVTGPIWQPTRMVPCSQPIRARPARSTVTAWPAL